MSRPDSDIFNYVNPNYYGPLDNFISMLSESRYLDDTPDVREEIHNEVYDELGIEPEESDDLRIRIGKYIALLEDDVGQNSSEIPIERLEEIVKQTEDDELVSADNDAYNTVHYKDGWLEIREDGNSDGWIATDTPVWVDPQSSSSTNASI